ncbi:MAG: efflux transporter outer membrane subunit, partial [Burkholderiaceae bacterium]
MRKLLDIVQDSTPSRHASWLLPLAICLLLGACAAGPDYVRPEVATPPAFKEMQGWKSAQPHDQELHGKWWEMFGDPLLNSLEEQVDISNQNLAQAEAQYRQAQVLARSARAGLFPTVTGNVSVSRALAGVGSSSNSAVAATADRSGGAINDHSLSLDASWEPDLWGRVRRTVEANRASAQASAADLQAARLSAQAQLAQNYLQLRVLDAQQQLLEDTIAAYQRSLQLTQNQYAVGVVAKVDVIQAQTQLKSTQAQALDVGVQRAQLEHAIALLAGQPASTFSIARAPLAATMPAIPIGVPSALLE